MSNKKKTGMVILLLAVLLLAVAGIWWAISMRSAIKTENAKVTGDLADVSSKVAGKISKIYVDEGQYVKAGQLLVKLDDSQYKLNLEQAQAALHIAQANYQKLPDDVQSAVAAADKATAGLSASRASLQAAQVALNDAKRQLNKNQELYDAGAISRETLDTVVSACSKAQSNYDAAAANVDASLAGLKAAQVAQNTLNNSATAVYQAQIEQAQAAYNSAKLAEDNTRIYAELDGNVLRLPVSIGENVSASQTLLTLTNLKHTWITANIEEKKIGRVQTGEKVDVTIDAFPGRTFTGTVIEVGTTAQSTFSLISSETTSGSFTKVAQRIPVKIKVDSGNATLKPGMSASVNIHTK